MDIKELSKLHQLTKYSDIIENDWHLKLSEMTEASSQLGRLNLAEPIAAITAMEQAASQLGRLNLAEPIAAITAMEQAALYKQMEFPLQDSAAAQSEIFSKDAAGVMENLTSIYKEQDLFSSIQSGAIENIALSAASQEKNLSEAYNILIHDVRSPLLNTAKEQLDIFDASSRELIENAAILSGLDRQNKLDQALSSAYSIYDDFNGTLHLII